MKNIFLQTQEWIILFYEHQDHTWRTIVLIQQGTQEMFIIICASKVSVDQYLPWQRQCYR